MSYIINNELNNNNINNNNNNNNNINNNNINNNNIEIEEDIENHSNNNTNQIFYLFNSNNQNDSLVNWKIAYIIYITYLIITSIILIISLFVDFNKPCSSPPIRVWSIVQSIIQITMLLTHFILFILQSYMNNDRVQQIYFLIRFLIFIWMLWFTIGFSWIFQGSSKDECVKTAPFLYKSAFSIIIIELSIIILLFLFCCCSVPLTWIYSLIHSSSFQINRRNYYENTSNRNVDSKIIKEVTEKKKYNEKNSNIPKEDANCAICLSSYKDGENLLILPCHHHFHSKCILLWLKKYNKACPLCKKDIDFNLENENENE